MHDIPSARHDFLLVAFTNVLNPSRYIEIMLMLLLLTQWCSYVRQRVSTYSNKLRKKAATVQQKGVKCD